jgi:hypothetical protein
MPTDAHAATHRQFWESWPDHLTIKATLPQVLPRLRLLRVMDNLVGHKNPDWLLWCFSHGILPMYTPLAASWLTMAESIQRLLKRRALDGTYPRTVEAIIHPLEAVASHWNTQPTPFIWAGKRKARRQRACLNRHPVGASATVAHKAFCRHASYWQLANQVTH